jgi:LmbE family N-acetylglucosaminyl deacetylase
MLHLDLKRAPHWLDLGHGVRVHVRPCTTALMMAARAEAHRSITPSQNETELAGERTAALVKALGRLGIREWEGVGDADGEPVPLTPEGVDALLDLWPMAEAFERLYLGPALLLDDEKNA